MRGAQDLGVGSIDNLPGRIPEEGLIADVGPRVGRLAIQLVPSLFEAENQDQYAAYEALLASLRAGMHLLVLVNLEQADRAEGWLSGLQPAAWTFEIIRVPGNELGPGIAWMRDAFLCTREGSVDKYLRTAITKNGGHADWLAAVDGAVVETRDVSLEGGDCLVGADFWIVGVKEVYNTMEIVGHKCDYATAEKKIATIDARRLLVVGYRISDLSYKLLWLITETRQRSAKRLPSYANTGKLAASFAGLTAMFHGLHAALTLLRSPRDLVQGWEHIDLVVSMTGVRDRGKEIVLVASTTQPPAPWSSGAASQNDRLNSLAGILAANGFHVIRNPAPFASSPKRIFPYNNTIVQNDPNVVWLPQFAGADGNFKDADDANVQIWRGLGFEVVSVPGWMAFLQSDGSIRCATSVLRR